LCRLADMTNAPAPGRRVSGGPVLQDEVTQTLAEAFFEELAAVGYGRLSLEAVAKRAGAGRRRSTAGGRRSGR
jgi:AcrR family transcriptional regulator